MYKINTRQVLPIKNILTAVAKNSIIVYCFVMLMKLFYFASQVGDKSFVGVHGLTGFGSLMILTALSLLMSCKASKWYMRTLNILLSLLIFSDLVFYRYFNDMTSIPLLFQAGSISDVKSSLLELLHWNDLILAIDIILLPMLNRRLMLTMQKSANLNKRKPIAAIVLCIVGGMLIYNGMSQLIKSQPTILQTFYDRVYVAQNIGLLNYHAADAYRFAVQSFAEKSELDAQKRNEIMELFLQKHKKEKHGQLWAAGKGKNLVVIQVEALQQFVINRSVNGQEITPNLNKLTAAGLYFDNYYYQTAGGGTSDAEFTSNISMYPMKEGAVYIRKPGNFYYSLPLKLKENNYSTMAMHGYKPGFWNRTMVYKNIGFDQFYSKNNMPEGEILGMGISDKAFLKQAVEKLKVQKQPYYAFLITLSSHFPYDNDKSKYSSFDVGEYKDTLLGNYLEAVHYTDEALGQFVADMESSGMLENTVLAIYGDHHGIPKDNEKELGQFLGKENLSSLEWIQLQKVPMLIYGADIEQKTISIPGGGVDFMPTVLNIMGIHNKNMITFGRDLLNSGEGYVVMRNGSFVTKGKIYISNENSCYDIDSGIALSEEQYKVDKEQVDKLLDYSDTIIKYDIADEIKNYLDKRKP